MSDSSGFSRRAAESRDSSQRRSSICEADCDDTCIERIVCGRRGATVASGIPMIPVEDVFAVIGAYRPSERHESIVDTAWRACCDAIRADVEKVVAP